MFSIETKERLKKENMKLRSFEVNDLHVYRDRNGLWSFVVTGASANELNASEVPFLPKAHNFQFRLSLSWHKLIRK